MWTHVVVAAVALFVYLYTRLGQLPWATPFASLALIRIGVPVLLPYAISAGICWQLDTWQKRDPGPVRVIGFLVALIAGGVIVDATLLGAFGHVEPLILLGLLFAQTVGYVGAAQWMIDEV